MNAKRTSWQPSQPSSNAINNNWNSVTSPQSPSSNQDWNTFKTELINNNPSIRNNWGTSNLEPASSDWNGVPLRQSAIDNSNRKLSSNHNSGNVSPARKLHSSASSSWLSQNDPVDSWRKTPSPLHQHQPELRRHSSQQFQTNDSWRQLPSTLQQNQSSNSFQQRQQGNAAAKWRANSSSPSTMEQSSFHQSKSFSNAANNQQQDSWNNSDNTTPEPREEPWNRIDIATWNPEQSTGWGKAAPVLSESPTSTVSELPEWRNSYDVRSSSGDVNNSWGDGNTTNYTQPSPLSTPPQMLASKSWNTSSSTFESSNQRRSNSSVSWNKPASNVNSWNSPPVGNTFVPPSNGNRQLGQTRRSWSKHNSVESSNWEAKPSWETKPPTSPYANNTDVPAPKIAAGWGNPIVHTNLNKRMSHQQLRSNSWNSNSSVSFAEKAKGTWEPQVVKVDNDDEFNSYNNSSYSNQLQNRIVNNSLKKTKSTASFFDSSKTIASGRVPRESGFPARQLEQLNKTITSNNNNEEFSSYNLRKKLSNDMNSIVPSPRIYVYGFPDWVRVRELIDIFCDYGSVLNVGIMSNEIPPFAFVDFEGSESTMNAVSSLRHQYFFDMDRPLEILHEKKPVNGRGINNISNGKQEVTDVLLESTTIHVGNIPQNVQRSEVEKLFGKYGDLKRVQIVTRQKENRAFAFICYKNHNSAQNAMNSLRNSKSLHFNMSEPLKMEYSKIEKKKLTEKSSMLSLKKNTSKDELKLAEYKKDKPFQVNTKNSVYINLIPNNVGDEEFLEIFKQFGNIKYYFFVNRSTPEAYHLVDDTEENSITESDRLYERYGIVIFNNEQDAFHAVNSNNFNCCFPYLKKLTLSNLIFNTKNLALECLKIKNLFNEALNDEDENMKVLNLDFKLKRCDLEFNNAENCFKILNLILEFPENFTPDLKVEYSSIVKRTDSNFSVSANDSINNEKEEEVYRFEEEVIVEEVISERILTETFKEEVVEIIEVLVEENEQTEDNGIIPIEEIKFEDLMSGNDLDVTTEEITLNDLSLDNIPVEEINLKDFVNEEDDINAANVEVINIL
ncbi:Protein phosphatase PP2A regulatory subunit B [Lobulomyces angularis]|nr:Protein phosphatase PP2A regulatory subunit B [Lobulomyces angularis]